MSKILVIDDDSSILRALRRILRGHELELVVDPNLALVRLDAGADFDVILCDLYMTVLSGMELYHRALFARPELADRFIFFTGNGTSEIDEFLARPGIRAIRKPFDLETLQAAIESVVAKKEGGA